jgi:soluble lytic murein transglycosylase-like protein
VKTVLVCAWLLAVAACNGSAQTREDPETAYYATAYARHYRVPVELVHAIISQESGWNQNAVSSKGARGLMQLMPATAQRFATRNVFDKSQNIGGGVRYLKELSDRFHSDLRLVLAAYYAGEGQVGKRGLLYGNPDVIAYVEQVRRRYFYEIAIHRERGKPTP